jgi:hypothetical protein
VCQVNYYLFFSSILDPMSVKYPKEGTTMKERDFSTRARRTTRVQIRIPVRIRVVDRSGKVEIVDAWTSVINMHGARLTGKRLFAMDEAVEITVPSTGRAGKGKIIWLGSTPAGDADYEFAVELDKPANLWAIGFPPGDWGYEKAPDRPGSKIESEKATPGTSTDQMEELTLSGPPSALGDISPAGAAERSNVDAANRQDALASLAREELKGTADPDLVPNLTSAPAPATAEASVSPDPSLAFSPPPVAAPVSPAASSQRTAAPIPPGKPAGPRSRAEATGELTPATADRLADAVRSVVASAIQAEQSTASEQLLKALEARMAQIQQESLERLTDQAARLVSAQSASIEQRAEEIVDRSEEALAERLRQATETGEQKARKLEGEVAATVTAALEGLRGQVTEQLPPVGRQFLEKCRSLADQAFSEMLENALRAMSLRIEEMDKNIETMQQKAQQILQGMSAQLEQRSAKAIAETAGRLESRLEKSAQQVDSSFQRQIVKELSERQKDLAEQFQQQIEVVSEKSVQEMRGALGRMLQGLADRVRGETLEQGTSGPDDARRAK